MIETLVSGGESIGINFQKEQIEKFVTYINLLREWNEKVNLTAITDPEEIAEKHFLDSLLLLPFVSPQGTLADIGTGAGFPGIPLKIMLPDLEVTLVDSLGKRVKFLQEIIDVLGLEGISAVHSRAEDIGRLSSFRGQFDIVVARAVSKLSTLSEYCLPLVKIGGVFIAAKGPAVLDEVAEAKYAIGELGGETLKIHQTALPHKGDPRTIVIIQKLKMTPNIYPRKAGTPEKKPLTKA